VLLDNCSLSQAQELPWEIAPSIWTCAAASQSVLTVDLSAATSAFWTLARLAVGFVSVHQTMSFLPKLGTSRHALFFFAIWPAISFLGYTPSNGNMGFLPEPVWPGRGPSNSGLHPIEDLIEKGRSSMTLT
jgi:hypothetical protein